MSRVAVPIASVAVAAFVQFGWVPAVAAGAHDALIAKHAAQNGVPVTLVNRVIRIESRGRATAVHKGSYGLMQIRLGTARALGYSGDAQGLLDPDINLAYGVKYLAGAYRAAGCDADRAVSYYKRGYHGVKRGNCGPAAVEVADVSTNTATASSAKRKNDAANAPVVDVLKPKLVRTELISRSKPEATPAQRPAKFEPVRVSALSAGAIQPVPIPVPKPAALAARPEPAAVAALATDAIDIVPLPRARPEPEAEAVQRKPHKLVHRAERRRSPASKPKAGDDKEASGVVASFLKKLTEPDKPPRRQTAQERVQTASPSPSSVY
jgi:transglycosylase-like protein with SLT domain